MPDNTLIALTVFTGIVAVALLLQSLAFVGIHRSMRNLSARMEVVSSDVMKSVGTLSVKAEELLISIKSLTEKTEVLEENIAATTSIVHKRVVDLDSFLQEATSSARLQMLRIQDVVDRASSKVENTLDKMHHGVLAPVKEVNAIARGVKVGLDVLLRKSVNPSATSHQDEEMFI